MSDAEGRGLTPLPPGPALVRRTVLAVTLGAAACGEDDKTSAATTATTEVDPTIAPMLFTTGPATTTGSTTVISPMRPPMPDPTTVATTESTAGTTGEASTTDDTARPASPPMPRGRTLDAMARSLMK